jgi:hypothetical protein
VTLTKFHAIEPGLNLAHQWMAHKLNLLNTSLFVPLAFEGKNRKQQIYTASYLLNSMLPPRPKLWSDVVDDFHAAAVKRPRQRQIEIRPIDQDYGIRSAFNSSGL